MLVRMTLPTVFDELLEDFLTPEFNGATLAYPPVDIMEDENTTVVVVELPGVKKEDVTLKYEKNILTINGERKPYQIPDDARVLLNEMRVRKFTRSISIPHDVDVEKVSAELNNGVLRVTLPKSAAARTRTIEIQ